MFFRQLFNALARARAPDKEFTIISHNTIPELTALAAAPNEVHAQGVLVSYNHTEHALTVNMHEESFTFCFREDHILVFSKRPFSTLEFREALKKAALNQRASTKATPRRFQEHVSESVR